MIGLDIDDNLISKANYNSKLRFPGSETEKINFIRSDIMSEIEVHDYHGRFEVISCFSVTKWVHLNHGDEGLQILFKRVHEYLTPGGIFILEPQLWRSYRKRRHLTERIASKFSTLKLRPQDFDSELIDLGFTLI